MSESTGDTMWAIGYTAAAPVDDPQAFVERQVPVPSLRPHDLLIEVKAVSVNPADVKMRAHNSPRGFRVLGFDASGVVAAVGSEASLFRVGDPVMWAGSMTRAGANAQLQAVDERVVGRKPTALDWGDAAALPLTALTAHEGLVEKLRLQEESEGTLLVVGAGGGVGSVVLQLAAAIAPKVRIVGTASSAETVARARQNGAHEIVDHHGDLAANVLAVAPDGVQWIFTTASAQPGAVRAYTRLLTPFGSVVAIDDPHPLDVSGMKSKALSWHWELMFARSMHDAPDLVQQHRALQHVADLVDAGRLRPNVGTRLHPLGVEQLREAHREVEAGSRNGRVVVTA